MIHELRIRDVEVVGEAWAREGALHACRQYNGF